MRLKETFGFFGLAILLFLSSSFFYLYSHKLIGFDSVNYPPSLSELLDSGKELHMSSENLRKLLEMESDRHNSLRKVTNNFRVLFKKLSYFQLILGILQIGFTILIYKKYRLIEPNKTDEPDVRS